MTAGNTPSADSASRRRDVVVAAACGVFVAAMVGAAYAAVPLYNWFCRSTGFGGTTQVSTAAPSQVLGRTITVRFDANVAPGLPWRFVPEKNSIDVHIGEVLMVNFVVTNLAARDTVGQASYNVTPPTTGAYFQKINCFCFTEQSMKAGETREMPVVFYIDPALAQDAEQNGLNTITLSYTYFSVRPEPVASVQGGGRAY
jgi:cytochrome c oxidase assembly protein subunit 11